MGKINSAFHVGFRGHTGAERSLALPGGPYIVVDPKDLAIDFAKSGFPPIVPDLLHNCLLSFPLHCWPFPCQDWVCLNEGRKPVELGQEKGSQLTKKLAMSHNDSKLNPGSFSPDRKRAEDLTG